MSDLDDRATGVITDWKSIVYKCDSHSLASLEGLIAEALRDQDKLTRHACADSLYADSNSGVIPTLSRAAKIVMNTTGGVE